MIICCCPVKRIWSDLIATVSFHLISAASMQTLQSVLNAAARLVTRKRKYDHITRPPPSAADPAGCILQAVHHGVQVPAFGSSSLSNRNVCSCRCQHWAPVPTFSITWWPDCTAHQDVTVRTTQFCGLRSVHFEHYRQLFAMQLTTLRHLKQVD